MITRPSSIRIPEEIRRAIEDTSRRTGRTITSVANEMLAEGVKMRRIPGIVFADEAGGRVPRIAGTGIEVFEVAETLRSVEGDVERLRQAYHWLTETQLRAALAYIEAYGEEIEDALKENEQLQKPEYVWERYPFTRPERR